MSQNRHWILLSLMLGGALLDQGSKWLAKTYLDTVHSLPVIPHVFQLSLSFNTGAAFSLFKNQPQLLAGFTTLLFLILLGYGLRKQYPFKGELTAMGLILGGALGNLMDRLLQGRVTDFFDVVAIRYPVFNVADSLIFIGVFWLVGLYLRQPTTTQTQPTTLLAHQQPAQPDHDRQSISR
jgi:signal peptidase II